MQPAQITLAVDVQNSGSATNLVLTRHEETVSRTTYITPSHTLITRDQVALLRTPNKRNGAFYGSAKMAVRFTKDVTVAQSDGTETVAPLIGELSFSIPVGATAAAVLELRQRLLAILDRDDVMDPLNNQLSI